MENSNVNAVFVRGVVMEHLWQNILTDLAVEAVASQILNNLKGKKSQNRF